MSPIKKTLQHPKATAEKRAVFCAKLKQYQASGRPLVSVDESGFAHDMPRLYGVTPKGQRCFGRHDWGSKKRTNVIGALLLGSLLAVRFFTTNINTLIFTQWVEQVLIPKLPPHSVVILDNATFHKGSTMQKSIEYAGHTLLYLPPYSPDLNPIEKKWAQAKSIRRKTACSLNTLFQQYVHVINLS